MSSQIHMLMLQGDNSARWGFGEVTWGGTFLSDVSTFTKETPGSTLVPSAHVDTKKRCHLRTRALTLTRLLALEHTSLWNCKRKKKILLFFVNVVIGMRCPPQCWKFEYLVPSWWCCLGKLRRVSLLEEGCHSCERGEQKASASAN